MFGLTKHNPATKTWEKIDFSRASDNLAIMSNVIGPAGIHHLIISVRKYG